MKQCYGKCALCGKETNLTFEHIPPRAAFNSNGAKPVSGKEIFREEVINDPNRMPWDTEGLRYSNQQQGMGRYSLCQECNNNTGSWYGEAYVFFAKVVNEAINEYMEISEGTLGIKDIYPLRIIKQIASMFCSVNRPDEPKLDELRKFVLDKERVGLDKSLYKICLYLTQTTLTKHTGMMVMLKQEGNHIYSTALSEIVAYPFGLILYFDPEEGRKYQGIDITCFADKSYDECCTIEMAWELREMNSLFPEDFRSREEIYRQKSQK